MSNLKILSMVLAMSTPLYFGAVQPASSDEWEGLTWSNMCDAANYVCSMPERVGEALDELDKELLDSADDVDEFATKSAEFLGPFATAAAQSDLDKVILTTGGEILGEIGKKTLAVGDKLATAVKVAGSLSTDKPDYVGASEAVYHGAVGGEFAAAGGAIGTVVVGFFLGSNPAGWAVATAWGLGAVGGAVVYINTVQPEASKAFEAIATKVQDAEFKDNMEEAEKQSSKVKQAQLDKLNCKSNLVANWNKGHPICICPGKNTRWLKALNKCVTKYEARDNCRQYPGSIIAMNTKEGCKCPDGTKWSKKFGRCAKGSVPPPVISGNQCPMKNPYKKTAHKRDTNGNPNDNTYLMCAYLTSGAFDHSKPIKNGKLHGIGIKWETNRKTRRRYKYKEILYAYGKVVKIVTYRRDGTVYSNKNYNN